jgi:hypothetical protein
VSVGDSRTLFANKLVMQPAIRAVLACVLVAGCGSYVQVRGRPVEAGFWFDPVTFDSARLGGSLTAAEVRTIEVTARAELADAFRGLPITFSDRHDALYRLRVMQEILDQRFKRPVGIAGQSRAIAGFGGSGAISFFFLASTAMAYAPPDADRRVLVESIGRGIGRTAAHELAHELLPLAPIHESRDEASYEFSSAARRSQFFGPMHWDFAWPLLQARLA